VVLYADRVTRSMQEAMGETDRRRQIQRDYNTQHGITPMTVTRAKAAALVTDRVQEESEPGRADELSWLRSESGAPLAPDKLPTEIRNTESAMKAAAKELDFERAAQLRDRLLKLKELELKWQSSSLKIEF
jgi:excinuclease ABC subunit B